VEVASLDAAESNYLREYPFPVHALGKGFSAWQYNRKFKNWLRINCSRFDHIIVEGIWKYHGYAARQVARGADVSYSVLTHGMLDPWFKRHYPLKHLKKWLFWPWAEYRVLRDARYVLFTCEEEMRLAAKSFWLYKANARVVPFGTTGLPAKFDDLQRASIKKTQPTEFLFLGRLHEKKGCDLLLQAFFEVKRKGREFRLVVAGPGDPEYVDKLKGLTETLGLGSDTVWPGMVAGEQKWRLLCEADAFILPSHQENFGVAVVEALSCGLPVIISDRVNIHAEITRGGGGIVHELSVEAITQSILKWIDLPESEKARYRESARSTFEAKFSVEAMAAGLVATLSARDG